MRAVMADTALAPKRARAEPERDDRSAHLLVRAPRGPPVTHRAG